MKINSYKWGWWQSPTIGKTNGVFTSTHMNVWCQVMCTDMYKNDSKNYFPQDLNMKFSILRLSGMSVLQFLLDNRNIVEILWEKKWSKLQVRNNINNTSPSCFNSHPFLHLKQAKQRYTSKKISITFPPQQTLQQTHWWSQDFRPNVGFTWPTFATKTPSSRAWRGSLRGSPACHVPPGVGVFYWWEGTPLYHQKMLEGCGIMWIANKETQIYTDKNDMTILDMRTHPIFFATDMPWSWKLDLNQRLFVGINYSPHWLPSLDSPSKLRALDRSRWSFILFGSCLNNVTLEI